MYGLTEGILHFTVYHVLWAPIRCLKSSDRPTVYRGQFRTRQYTHARMHVKSLHIEEYIQLGTVPSSPSCAT